MLITGGAQRVGLSIARYLNQLGQPVLITYRTPRAEIDTLEAEGIMCIQADFSTQQGIELFINWVKLNVVSLRAIIHNASDWLAESDACKADELMQKMIQIHVQTPYQLNLALSPLLQKCQLESHKLSDIIHITDYAVEKGSSKHIAYCASKAALDNLTLSFAQLFAASIKVNTIAPSLIVFNQNDTDEYKQKTLKKSLLGIEPGTQEMVLAVEYILTSDYMTGRQLKLDGGRHLV